MEDLLKMTRKQLQALCKKHDVAANLKNAEMIKRLALILKDEVVQVEEQSGSGAGYVQVGNAEVEAKKKVGFSAKNGVGEYVDTCSNVAEEERGKARRGKANRRRGLRRNELTLIKDDEQNAVETGSYETGNAKVESKKRGNQEHESVDMYMEAVEQEQAEAGRDRVTRRRALRKDGLTMAKANAEHNAVESANYESENVKGEAKKKVRFSPENLVHEFVDTYTEAVKQEQAKSRTGRATRRKGLRNKGKADEHNAVETASLESKERFSSRVRLTRSGKSVVISSPPLKKWARTGGKAATETGEKESLSNSDLVDFSQTNASKVKEFDETFVVGNGDTMERISRIAEVNSLDSEPLVETISVAEVPRRTCPRRKFKGNDRASIMGSDNATGLVIKHDSLARRRDSVQDEALPRKSSRVVMKNISNMPENQMRETAGVHEKQKNLRPGNEFPKVISDDDENITIKRKEEENANQIKKNCMLRKSLRSSTSVSSTVARLEIDSSKENQQAQSSEVELPMVKPLRRSRRKNDGNDALGLPDVNSFPADSNHTNQQLKQTKTNEAEYCLEGITSNVTCDCSESDVLEDNGQLCKKLEAEKKHRKRRKISETLVKEVCKSVKNDLGKTDILNQTDGPEFKDANSAGLLSITEVVKDDICSAKSVTPSDSNTHDEVVGGSVFTNGTLLGNEPISVPAVEESLITACDSNLLQKETITAGQVLGFEESDNHSEFSKLFSYNLPHVGCTGDEVPMETGEKHAVFDKKRDYDSSVSSDARLIICLPTEGVQDQDASNMEEAVIFLSKSPSEGTHEITNAWHITKGVVSNIDACGKIWSNVPVKQINVDGDIEMSSEDAEQPTEPRLPSLNEEIFMLCRANKDKEPGDQDSAATNAYMPGYEVVENIYGDTKKVETTSDDNSSANKISNSSVICSPFNAEGNSDGKRSDEKVSVEHTDSLELDGRPIACVKLDPEEEVPLVEFSETLEPQLYLQEADSIGDTITGEVDGTSEAGRARYEDDSLSLIAESDDRIAAEPSQEIDNESGDVGMTLPATSNDEVGQDGLDEKFDEVCTTLNTTNSEVDHSGNAVLDDASLVSSEFPFSFHESQAERDAEEVLVVQLSETLVQQHHVQEADSTVDTITMNTDGTSEADFLSIETGSARSEEYSLSIIAENDENATNHLAAEPSQEIDNETNDSLLHFTGLNKQFGDVGMIFTTASKNEFGQDGVDGNIDEVCTTLNATNSEVDHFGNDATDDAGLVSLDSSFSFHESQAKRDADKVPVVQFTETLEPQHHLHEADSTVGVTKKGDGTSETDFLSIKVGSARAVTVENITNHLAAEPSQKIGNETHDRLLYFTGLNKQPEDVGMTLSAASENEFGEYGQGGIDGNIDEVCTPMNAKNSEASHSGNIATDDASLVSSDSSFSLHESQAEIDAETTGAEDFTDDKSANNPNVADQLNGVSQNLSKEIASNYRGHARLTLYYSETSQSEEINASCSLTDPCLNMLTDGQVSVSSENATDGQITASNEEAIGEGKIDEYSMNTLSESISKQSTKAKNVVEDDNTIPELGDRLINHALGDLDNAVDFSMDFMSSCDAKNSLTRPDSGSVRNVECRTRTEAGGLSHLTNVNMAACEDYGLKNCTDDRETTISKDTQVSFNGAGIARESTSYAEFPSFDKLGGLLREIDEYFEWRNSEKKVLEENVMSSDTKEKGLNSNTEIFFEVPVKIDCGRNIHMHECKCTAGIDAEVYAAPCKGHGEHNDLVGCLITEACQVDLHEDIMVGRCSKEHELSGYVSGRRTDLRTRKLS